MFAIEYLKLIQKYQEILNIIEKQKINSLFGVMQPYPTFAASSIYFIKERIDYEEEYQCTITLETKDNNIVENNECVYSTYHIKDLDLFNRDIVSQIEDFLFYAILETDREKFQEEELVKFATIDKYPVTTLIGVFYMSVIKMLRDYAEKDYNLLKEQFPSESFYPSFNSVFQETLTYYESSRCW